MYFGNTIKFWETALTGGIHFPATVIIESSLNFNVPKCLGKFVFYFGGGVLIDDTLGTSVCQ